MQISRRDFIKMAATAAASLGASSIAIEELTSQLALAVYTKPPVLWIQGQNCTGCTTSFLGLLNRDADVHHHEVTQNADTMRDAYSDAFDPAGSGGSSAIEDVLLDVIDLQYNPTAMGPAGQRAVDVLNTYAYNAGSNGTTGFVLVIEGPIPDATINGGVGENACSIGYYDAAHTTNAVDRFPDGPITMKAAVQALARNAAAVIAVGTCAAYGGIPAARNGSAYPGTGATAVSAALTAWGAPWNAVPVVNVPGCVINPDWLYLTVAQYILGAGTLLGSLDQDKRPTQLLGKELFYRPVHSGNCINYQAYCDGDFATSPGQKNKCLFMLGCRGPSTNSACSKRNGTDLASLRSQNPKWNDIAVGVSTSKSRSGACINCGAPCIGCTEKGFPDKFSPFINY